MNILKKAIAPISDKAWEELREQSDRIFKIYLSGRKFVDLDGPNGWEFGAVPTGRLVMPKTHHADGINYGIREVLPLVEVRKPFELDVWELDNIDRGASDANLEPMEEAAKEIALFEEQTIYQGFREAGIKGLENSATQPAIKVAADLNEFIKAVGSQVADLRRDGVGGPYTLVVSDNKWQNLVSLAKGYPVTKQLGEILGGNVIVTRHTDKTYLVSQRGGDFELTLGQDLAMGYDGHNTEKVKLYFTESFTFRVLTPDALRIISTETND